MRDFARYMILAPLMTAAAAATAAAPAAAQTPVGQSCGGLLCDLGVIGHKVPLGADGRPLPPPVDARGVAVAEPRDPHSLPCHDFVCGAFGHRDDETAQAAPAAAPVAATPVVAETPEKPVRKARRKHVAKASAAAPDDAAK